MLKYKLQFIGGDERKTDLIGYCDADWASDIQERRLVAGYIFLKNEIAISWSTRRKPTVAMSTTDSEYMTVPAAAQDLKISLTRYCTWSNWSIHVTT